MSIGKFTVDYENQTGIGMVLYDFAIGSNKLEVAHIEAIKTYVIGYLMGGLGSVSALGTTSRTGSQRSNLRLSKRRASAVANYLVGVGLGWNQVRVIEGLGEYFAATRQVADGTENETDRAVLISVWQKPFPPPIKKKFIIETTCEDRGIVDMINNNEELLVKGGQGKGNHSSLHQFIREYESQLLTVPFSKQSSEERRLLYFYKSNLFADWYLYGHCGVVNKYKIERIVEQIPRFLSKKGRKTHGKDTGSFDPADLQHTPG